MDNRLSADGPSGCLLTLLVPLALLALGAGTVAVGSAADAPTTTARARVLSVEPHSGTSEGDGRYCFTVGYEAAGATRTYRTCDVTARARAPHLKGEESQDAEDERFRRDNPVGSEVKVLRLEEPPHTARGAIADEAVSIGGGSRGMTAGASLVAVVAGLMVVALARGLMARRR